MKYFKETLYDSVCQEFRVDKLYFEQRTDHQHLNIFHNATLGRVMTLDGVVQTTEADEFIYHEMMAHVPIFAHGKAKKVLIIGGGDGGMLREVLRHKSVKEVVLVEIDQTVIDMSKQFLPRHSAGGFDDPRARILIGDGVAFVRDTTEKFDVIISDSTDPIGPGGVLFSQSFFALCKERLNKNGVMATQNGVPFFQMDEISGTYRRMKAQFADATFFSAAVPTYYGGIMAFSWGTDNTELRNVSLETLQQRYNEAGFNARYYNPAIHLASFALPQYIIETLGEEN